MDNLNLLVTLYLDHYQDNNDSVNRELFNDITWSPFDRIHFTSAKSLEELCGDNYLNEYHSSKEKNESGSKSWTGVKQCMHLIGESFDDDNRQHSSTWKLKSDEEYVSNQLEEQDRDKFDKEPIFIVTNVNGDGCSEKEYAFHCIYSMRFSNTIQKLRNDDQIYDKKLIRKEIFKKVWGVVQEKNMDFRCFRSLGSEDMVIIFLSDSMKEIVTVVDYINRLKIILPAKTTGLKNDTTEELFSTVCVFSGFNNPNYNDATDLDLIIHLNLKHNNPQMVLNELIQKLKTRVYRRSIFLGMGAIKLYIRAGKITYEAFHERKPFNGTSRFYKDNIYSSRTYFCIPSSVAERSFDKDKLTVNIMNLGDFSILNANGNNNGDTGETIVNLKRINPVADFVFGEYKRLLSSQRTIQWHEILTSQYKAVKSFVEYYSKQKNTFDECAMLNYAQSSLHLINQACSPVSEVPNHNHFYAGSFHDLIKSYYGIINMLFDLAYNLPRAGGTYQHPITFAICLNAVARIESKIFTRHDQKNRVVIFFLPYDSFWNYAENIKLLVHESFHYIAPYDRRFRASCFVKIIYNFLAVDRINQIAKAELPILSLDDANPNKINVAKKISEWMEYIVKRYDDIEKDLLKKLDDRFHGFFVHSNPEWSLLFLNVLYPDKTKNPNSKPIMDDIIFVIDNYVKDVICQYHDDVMKNLMDESSIETCSFRRVFNHEMVKRKISELSLSSADIPNLTTDLYKKIRTRLKMYDIATKEAFCDLWSIRITDLQIPQYLAVLLKAMSKAYNQDSILEGIEAEHLRQTNIDIRATVIRMIILIHKFVNDERITNISNTTLAELLLEKSGKGNRKDKDFLSQCFGLLNKKYMEFTANGKWEIEAICNIAFHRIDKTMKDIGLYDNHGNCRFLKEAASTNLHKSIRMDQIDHLSNFIGKHMPEKGTDKGKPPEFIRYERIGEDGHYKMLVSSFGEFLESVDEIQKKVSGRNDRHILWYRGICSDNFSLLPSIFRKGDPSLSIYANQANVIKRAYFSTLYAADIWNLPIEQRMAYLQHYGMPTNLLDFSIDPLTSLHFAITPDVAADRQKVDNGSYQPVVYVFDPMVYSRAIRRMAEWKPSLIIPDTISSVNFDINSNSNERSEFFVEDMSYDYLYKHNVEHTKTYFPNDRGDPFPVPIVIQQSNQRIIAQSGTFVAFSLHALPQDIEGEGRFEYLDLLRIQKRYLNFLHETSNFEEQFIFPIYLHKGYISTLRENLQFLNVSTGKFYPELNKVFEETNLKGLNDRI